MEKSGQKDKMKVKRNELRDRLINLFPRSHGQLLPALHYLHNENGYLPDWAMEVLGWHLGIPASEVYGAATSYSEFRLTKPTKHIIRVCSGLSCLVNGAKDVLNELSTFLAAESGESFSTSSISLEEIPCGYLCGNAPVVQIDGSWVGNVKTEMVESLIDKGNLL